MTRGLPVVLLVCGVVAGASACASAPIRKQDQALVVQADARVLEGCYDCLREARATYERLAVGKARPLLITRLFEVQVLVGLREKELALDPSDAFGKAKALVPELPPTYPAARYLEVAGLVPPDFAGTPRSELAPFRQARAPSAAQFDAIAAELRTGEGSPEFRSYLAASLECAAVAANRRGAGALPAIPADAPPLVRYRLSLCPILRPSELESLVTQVPQFVEAQLFVARQPTLAVTAAYVAKLRAALTAAQQRFPRSASITYGFGSLAQTIGDCKAAVRHYEDTLTLKPVHEDATLQRAICLTFLGQPVQAIEGTTTVIDRNYDNRADAYYWRAWNQRERKNLPQAREDIEAARKIRVNAKVLTLNGMIKYDQRELANAEKDFVGAIGMDSFQCIAHWYWGLVGFELEAWADTAPRFEGSSRCYKASADDAVSKREAMRTADVDPDFKAAQIAGFDAAIKEDRDQEHASYLNAANAWARAGQTVKALEWLDKVPSESIHAGTAAQLRKIIGGGVRQ